MSNYLPSLFGENLMDVFDGFDRDFFRGFWRPEQMLYGKNAQNLMKTDVKETEGGYEVAVDLPGFKKDEIALNLQNGNLTITARKGVEKKEEDKEGKMLRQERYAGTLSRSFYVGDAVTEEDSKARYEDGVLTLAIPKKDPAKVNEKKTILIEG